MKPFKWLPWAGLTSDLFGHRLHFAAPRREMTFRRSVEAFRPTRSSCCGEETLAFYDSAYDARTGEVLCRFSNESAWAMLEAETNISGISDELSLARRRYYHCEEASELGQFLDIWVHRNGYCGDLREPANLRRAAETYITQESLARRAAEEQGCFGHGRGVFDDEEGEVDQVAGVNWRQRELCGRRWQLYEEYHRHYYFGESWLLPLGEKHFLRVHLYGMGSESPSREAIQELRAFIEGSMRRFHVQSPDTEVERPGNVNIELSDIALGQLDKRQNLEEETVQMPYLLERAKPRVRLPLFASGWWLLAIAVCLMRGAYGLVEYLGWEQTLRIAVVVVIASFIHKKLKNFVREPQGSNSGG